MTPLEAAVLLQAAYIRDGSPGHAAAGKAWDAVREIWNQRPKGWKVTSQESSCEFMRDPAEHWADFGAIPDQSATP